MEERSMPNDSYFLPCWQRRTIDFDEQKDAEKADTLRFCLSQLRFLQSQAKSADSWILDKKIKETFFEYSKLVDSKDKLNNYAAPILSQSKSFSKPNESKKWKCHLNSEDLKAQYLNRVKKKTNDDHNDDNEYIQLIDWIKQSELAEAGNLGSSSSINQSSLKSVAQRKETTLESQPTSLHVDPKNLFAIFGTNKSSGLEEKDLKLPKMERKVYPWEAIQKQNNLSTSSSVNTFRTASQQLMVENARASGSRQPSEPASNLYGSQRRSLGARRGINSKFIPPVKRDDDELSGEVLSRNRSGSWNASEESPYQELMQDERLKNIDAKMVELIMNEIMDSGPPVSWDDIAGLELAKNTIKEIIVWPMLRPDIFTGLRRPPKGILLFGPPGTGKTMIGKCIASQSHSTFFSISASSLTSKWVGDGEKMVRAMFAVARCHQPAVIFIDEIDSLLIQRSDTEHESSRRIKTEFLVQLDGATSDEEDRLLVVGATNRPQELDEAARRRLVKRLYIPLPGQKARQQIIVNLLVNQKHDISSSDIEDICSKTEGYSGADMANLCREAALGPIRAMNFADIERISIDEVRPITADDFVGGLRAIRASVSHKELNVYEDWNCKYGINQQM